MAAELLGSLPGWADALVAVGFLVGLGAVAYLVDRRMNRAFERLARDLGLKYHEHGPAGIEVPETFILAPSGRLSGSDEVHRVLRGQIDGVDVAAFEYRRISDPTKRTTRGYPATVSTFSMPDRGLPDFILRPERLYDRVLMGIADQDIDFTETPEFSRLYRLQGQDEMALRPVFSIQVRRFFQGRPGRVAQAVGGRLFYYRPTRMLRYTAFRAGEVKMLLSEGLELSALLWGGP